VGEHMNNEFDIKLNIPKGKIVSPLRTRVFEDELNNINKENPLEENQVNLATTYFLNNGNELEVGFFIRNTMKSALSLEVINLAVQSSKGDIIATLQCNLKEIGTMPSCTGTPYSLKFTLNEGAMYNKDEEYEITFVNFDGLKGFSSVETEIENMPINMSFEEEEALLNFEKNLATLKKDEINISIFRSIKTDNGGIDITLLIRNGYIKLERLPITIMNYNNYPICKHVFNNSNGLVSISSLKAKLIKLSIDPSKVYNTVFDLDRCKILFQ